MTEEEVKQMCAAMVHAKAQADGKEIDELTPEEIKAYAKDAAETLKLAFDAVLREGQ